MLTRILTIVLIIALLPFALYTLAMLALILIAGATL